MSDIYGRDEPKIQGQRFRIPVSDPKYIRELYLYLHPENQGVTEAECELVIAEKSYRYGTF